MPGVWGSFPHLLPLPPPWELTISARLVTGLGSKPGWPAESGLTDLAINHKGVIIKMIDKLSIPFSSHFCNGI